MNEFRRANEVSQTYFLSLSYYFQFGYIFNAS
jgi:hypothetical protein